MRKSLSYYITATIFLTLSITGIALADTEIEYDISRNNDQLTVLVDLSELLGSSDIENLRSGVDFLLKVRIQLVSPRKLYGHRNIRTIDNSYRISFRTTVGQYRLTDKTSSIDGSKYLARTSELLRFLRDSIIIKLVSIDSLETDRNYQIRIHIETISLTTINLMNYNESISNESETPLLYFFRQFLMISGHGKREYTAESRSFSLEELNLSP